MGNNWESLNRVLLARVESEILKSFSNKKTPLETNTVSVYSPKMGSYLIKVKVNLSKVTRLERKWIKDDVMVLGLPLEFLYMGCELSNSAYQSDYENGVEDEVRKTRFQVRNHPDWNMVPLMIFDFKKWSMDFYNAREKVSGCPIEVYYIKSFTRQIAGSWFLHFVKYSVCIRGDVLLSS